MVDLPQPPLSSSFTLPTPTQQTLTRTHPMVLRHMSKPHALLSTRHPLPEALLTSLDSQTEPTCFTAANKHPLWRQAMQEEFNALLQNNT